MSGQSETFWPAAERTRALEALAKRARLLSEDTRCRPMPPSLELGEALMSAAVSLGIEVEPTFARLHELRQALGAAAPALVALGQDRIALLAERRGSRLVLLGRDGVERTTGIDELARRVIEEGATRTAAMAEDLLATARVPPGRAARARRALVRELARDNEGVALFLLRPDPGDRVVRELARLRFPARVARSMLAHLGQLGATLGAWALLGRSIFSDRVERGWVLACSLLFATAAVLHVVQARVSGNLAIDVGAWMRTRLLAGALRIEPDRVRREGLGSHLGRMMEAETFQAIVLSGAFGALLGVMELCAATIVTGLGAGGVPHALLLTFWVIVFAALLVRYWRARRSWTDARVRLTGRTIERLLAYETRLVSEPRTEWHEPEDRELADYVSQSQRMDRSIRAPKTVIARGWLAIGLLALGPALVGSDPSAPLLAVGVGGVLLAYSALGDLSLQATLLIDAGITWQRLRELFAAAERAPHAAQIKAASGVNDEGARPLLELRDVVFAYEGRPREVLSGVDLVVRDGDRCLLVGGSGHGKSTVLSLMGGLRSPTGGLVLQRGLDMTTLGADAWRSRVVTAPQFHENHVLTGTLAYNLLLGRGWPPTQRDLEEAEEVCRDLGLGPLIERMPSGIMTIVGETGWQLSHGERSRIFLARALLQRADVVLLDETFAALDPATARLCVETARRRARTLVVVAHV